MNLYNILCNPGTNPTILRRAVQGCNQVHLDFMEPIL